MGLFGHRDVRIRGRKSCEFGNNEKHSAQCGFSLIELIIVIAIMAVLVGLISPQFVKMVQKKRCETCRANREAILRIYERAVYDGSVPIYLKEGDKSAAGDGILRVVDYYYADSSDSAFGIHNEISQYMTCPVKTGNTAPYKAHINSATGAAYIECEECAKLAADGKDYATSEVSIDMLGWADKSTPAGADPEREEPTTSSEEPTTEEEFLVKFNLNGHGSPKPADQIVKSGEKVTKPADPSAATYTFLGWFTDSAVGTKYTFTESVTADMVLYAHWEGMGGGSKIWPYADDSTWWDAAKISSHAGYYDPSNTQLNFDAQDDFAANAKIAITAPSGIFTSRSGAQFVYVDVNGTGSAPQLELKEASSPEYYSAKYPNYLVLLTGQKTVINITGKGNNAMFNHTNPGQYKIPLLTHGDLVEFVDGENSYLYVYWEGQTTDRIVNISEIRAYANHPNGLYRVNR